MGKKRVLFNEGRRSGKYQARREAVKYYMNNGSVIVFIGPEETKIVSAKKAIIIVNNERQE
jgi:hypothetical protein